MISTVGALLGTELRAEEGRWRGSTKGASECSTVGSLLQQLVAAVFIRLLFLTLAKQQ